MKILEVYPELLYDKSRLIITFEKGQNQAVSRLYQEVGTIDPKKDYEVVIKPKKKLRSMDCNRYFWILVKQLGEVENKPYPEIYKNIVRDNGVYQIVPIREDLIERWDEIWRSKGSNGDASGWMTEDIGECRNTKGYHNIKCYYGSSVYDQKEMSRLIDEVVYMCKERGIPTETPDEIARMKAAWGDKK